MVSISRSSKITLAVFPFEPTNVCHGGTGEATETENNTRSGIPTLACRDPQITFAGHYQQTRKERLERETRGNILAMPGMPGNGNVNSGGISFFLSESPTGLDRARWDLRENVYRAVLSCLP
jgi:hypothetical protein